MNTSPSSASQTTKVGVLCAIAAYTMWGIAPVYFKQLQAMPAVDVLMHRIIWSAVLLFGLITALKQWPKVKVALQSKRVMRVLFCAGLLLGANWLLFIWAINNEHLLEASLGYYINPLINVFFGRVFLGETLRTMQKAAVGLAIAGVAILIFSFGQVPWIALVLAVTFSIYGLLRKKVAVDSLPGLFIETIMLLPFALIYWVYFATEYSNMLNNDWTLNLLLMAAGIVTTAPLLCFTAAARRLMYSTLGFFQYIGPTIMFMLALLVYGEPFEMSRIITFAFVWLALLVFTGDSLRAYREQQRKLQIAREQT